MSPARLGLRENLGQFSLLVVVNAFVGAVHMRATLRSPVGRETRQDDVRLDSQSPE